MSRLGLAISSPLRHSELVQIVIEAQRRRLDSFWLTEGLGKNAFTQLAALSTHTQDMTLGTAIVNIYSRSATVMAMSATTLADVTNGRFILGLGSGHKPAMENLHDMQFEKPIQRMRDYATIIRSALTGKTVTHNGSAHGVRNLKLHFHTPSKRVPIYIAALGVGMARLAGEVADGVILHLATQEHVARVKQAIADGAAAAGRDTADIDLACFIMCRASTDQDRARRDIVNSIAMYGSMHFYRELLRGTGFHEEADAFQKAWKLNDVEGAGRCVSERLLQELPVAAGREEIHGKVASFRKAGVDLPIIYPTTDIQGTLQSILTTMEATVGT